MAGSKDMTKYHKEIMKKFKPKVMKTETNKNDKSDDGDGLDAVQPDVVKKPKTVRTRTLTTMVT